MGVGWGGGGGEGEPLEELVPSKERRERRSPPAHVPSPADFTVAIFIFCHGKFGN